MRHSNSILLRIRTLWIIPAVVASILFGAVPAGAQDAATAASSTPKAAVTLEQLIEQFSVEERLWAAKYCLQQAAVHPAEQRLKLYVSSLRFIDAVPAGHVARPKALKLRAEVLRRVRQDAEVLALLSNPAPAPTTESSDWWLRKAASQTQSTSAGTAPSTDWVRPAEPRKRAYVPAPPPTASTYGYPCAENGSCYGDPSTHTGAPKTIHVRGYYRKDGTYVRGHYRSRGRRR